MHDGAVTDDRLARARALLEVERPGDALMIAGAVLASDPGNGSALLIAAECHLHLDRADLAWERAREASSLSPEAAEPLGWMALADLKVGLVERARDEAHQAVLRGPLSLFARTVLVETLLGDRETTVAARREAYQALALDPTNPNTHLLCARAHLDTGVPPTIYEVATAQRHVDEVLRQDPGSPQGLAMRGVVSAAAGRGGAARRDLAAASRAVQGSLEGLALAVREMVLFPALALTALQVVTGVIVAAGWEADRASTLAFARLMVLATAAITVGVGLKLLLDVGRPVSRSFPIVVHALGRGWAIALVLAPVGLYAATLLSHGPGTAFAWVVMAALIGTAIAARRTAAQ